MEELTPDLNKLSTIPLPRLTGNGVSLQLCFCDSSNKTYATVIYLRVVNNEKVTVSLIFSK